MADLLFAPAMAPFTLGLALFLGLLALELVTLMLGGSLLGLGGDADLDADLDIDIDTGFDLDADLDLAGDLEGAALLDAGADLDAADIDVGSAAASTGGSAVGWLGLGAVPFILWFAALLVGFGLSGLVIQTVSNAVFGFLLPALVAVPPALIAAVLAARTFGAVFSRLLPKDQTSATAISRLGGRRGVITQGTARRDHAAEVRVTDAHGNAHYLRAEPLDDDAAIPQGADVLVMRQRTAPGHYRFRLIEAAD